MLAAGTTLGPYEILAPLGAGGMGEVYRARDTRLDRIVAIKVLPGHLSADAELRQRFEREARAVSSLNHPRICTIHDVGRDRGVDYLVMEYLEGESLAERIARGPLPADEMLRIGIEIAEALERAHRGGLVHRDLKPGNVMLTKVGAKLLDFGLARPAPAAALAGGSIATRSGPLTAEGSIVGTFQYMAPEQLEGGEADARSDVWALGATLYEMATGQPAFQGRSAASLIAAILEREPAPMSSLAPLTPPALDRLVRVCLSKDPDERVQTAHDVKLQLEWILEGGSAAGVTAPVRARRRNRVGVPWIVAAAAVAAALGLTAALILRPSPVPVVARFQVPAPRGLRTFDFPRLSPDGRMLAFMAADSAMVYRIWVRPLNATEARPLPGTEGAGRPFWSPDSRQVAFFLDEKLFRMQVAGGPPQLICEARGSDGTWGRSGTILFDGGVVDSIWAVSAKGGTPIPVTFLDRTGGEYGHGWPCFLPDGRHFIFLAHRVGRETLLKLGTVGERATKVLAPIESRAEYAAPGFLVYVQDGILVARRFDARRGRLTGELAALANPVAMPRAADREGSGNFSASQNGTIAFQADATGRLTELAWTDRQGRRLATVGPPDSYWDFSLSPDESRLAVGIASSSGPSPLVLESSIWVRDLASGTMSRLSFEPGTEGWPVWSPDGQSIAYAANLGQSRFRVLRRRSSGVGEADTLYAPAGEQAGPADWSPDGKFLVCQKSAGRDWDLTVVAPDGSGRATPVQTSPVPEQHGRISPDGHWIAYSSEESGSREVYVQGFPRSTGKWQVSTAGGDLPQWRRDGRELFYLQGDRDLMAVSVTAGAEFKCGVPDKLFSADIMLYPWVQSRWVPSRDGQRFLLNTPTGGRTLAPITVVMGWPAEIGSR